MSSDYKKSAKDLAFDKERAVFRKKMRELEREVSCKDNEIRQLKNVISQKRNGIISEGRLDQKTS